MANRFFTCKSCGGTFPDSDEDEARAEAVENGWGDIPPEDMAIVCDDCYKQMTSQGPPTLFNLFESIFPGYELRFRDGKEK